MEYKDYSILVYQRARARWTAEIRRLDGQMIKAAGTENLAEVVSTSEDEATFDAALQKARDAIDAGEMAAP